MKKFIYVLVFLCIFAYGCGRVGENTVKDILEKDPSFEKIVRLKKEINAEISELSDKYCKEQDASIQKIRSIKKDMQEGKAKLNAKILSLKQKINPEINELTAKLEKKKTKYKLKKEELKDVRARTTSIQKLLGEKSELSLSGDEISIWNKRAQNLVKKEDSLIRELDELQSRTRIIKTEIKILKE